jgi:transposase
MVARTSGSQTRQGAKKMAKRTTKSAGIDTSKHTLDIAVHGRSERLQAANSDVEFDLVVAWLRKHRVKRVGIEATGGYEREIVAVLRASGFEVVVFQPKQVRAYAQFRLKRAKNDAIDAGLIAACTAAVETLHPVSDERLTSLSDRLTFIEQIDEDIVRLKTRLEGHRDLRVRQTIEEQICKFRKLLAAELKGLVAALRAHADLGKKLGLVQSIPGIGLKTAVSILIRLPEIGTITREVAAALVGLAPYDNDSGQQTKERHIAGGRGRLRKALFAAALPASFRWNSALVALYKRLIEKGKPHRVALVACARKLIIYANTVVARGTPWATEIGVS